MNYRNTREILEAAFGIIRHFCVISPVPQDEILEPEYAFRQGSRPSLYECASRKQQLDTVLWFLSVLSPDEFDATCIGSPTESALGELEAACAARGWPTFRITGETSRAGVIGKGIKFSLLPELKGYEFRQVYLMDLTDSQLLPKGMPWEERWRIAFQLYVAMTRARDDLVMTFVQNRSTLLKPLWDSNAVAECNAAELLGT
jgi:superfamily I DNA/RNA helicase